ncbi:MAG: M64 family metallopeptidase [Gaiella sp.]
MGTADGAIVSTTKIVDHGPNASRWNLVILSEGYKAAELNRFHLDAEAFVNKLFATQPFTQMWCALNVHRVDVSSIESGADHPATCADGIAGTGASAKTYFDASFCKDGTTRLLYGDEDLAIKTAKDAVPQVSATIVIVNDPQYGGAGGRAAWFSTDPRASEIGIHELGHSAFALADEYGENVNTYTGSEPPEPNVTADTNRATTKWASRIAASTAVPTLTNPNCAVVSTAPSPVPAGTIGLFAGGKRANCGIYHSEYECAMRILGRPFCVVCREAIKRKLSPHLPEFSGPLTGTQFRGTLAARGTTRYFTYNWPVCWHVIWTVVPTTPVSNGPGLQWRVKVERSSRERLTYWLEITNLTDSSLDLEGRYEIVARV